MFDARANSAVPDPTEFAPSVVEFPYTPIQTGDQPYLPSSVEWFLSRVQLHPDAQSQPSGPPVDPTTMSTANAASYLQINDPSATSPVRSGDIGSAVAYVHTLPMPGNLTDIQYWLFYPVRGRSTVRIIVGRDELDLDLLAPSGSAYQGPGEHQGDWKHVTVRVNQQNQVMGVYYAQHATGQWYQPGQYQVVPGTQRPIVYASRNTHSCLPQPGKFDQLDTRHSYLGFSVSLLEWTASGATWDCSQGLINLDTVAPAWNHFPGHWGPPQSETCSPDTFNVPNLSEPFEAIWGLIAREIASLAGDWITNPQNGAATPADQPPYTNGDQ